MTGPARRRTRKVGRGFVGDQQSVGSVHDDDGIAQAVQDGLRLALLALGELRTRYAGPLTPFPAAGRPPRRLPDVRPPPRPNRVRPMDQRQRMSRAGRPEAVRLWT